MKDKLMPHHLLTFELTSNQKELEVHMDKQGVKELISYLEPLLTSKNSDHIHLSVPLVAGDDGELSMELQGENNTLLNWVSLRFWAD